MPRRPPPPPKPFDLLLTVRLAGAATLVTCPVCRRGVLTLSSAAPVQTCACQCVTMTRNPTDGSIVVECHAPA